jgi:hypothetical protein
MIISEEDQYFSSITDEKYEVSLKGGKATEKRNVFLES